MEADILAIIVGAVVGALVTTISNAIRKFSENRYKVGEKIRLQKQNCYIEFISLLSEVLALMQPEKRNGFKEEREEKMVLLSECINKIKIIGSNGVIHALDEYWQIFGQQVSSAEQESRLTKLVKEFRVDARVDKKLNDTIPPMNIINISEKRPTMESR